MKSISQIKHVFLYLLALSALAVAETPVSATNKTLNVAAQTPSLGTSENDIETIAAFKKLQQENPSAIVIAEEPNAKPIEPKVETANPSLNLAGQKTQGLKPSRGKLVKYKPYTQVGKASWYGTFFHGRLTANGERYNKWEMTAAHRYLPLNTMIRVTNLANNKSIILRINDRGPFKGNRILDVSRAAAEALRFKNKGLAKVKIETVDSRKLIKML